MDNPSQFLQNSKTLSFIVKLILSAVLSSVLSYITLTTFYLYNGFVAEVLLSILFTLLFLILLNNRFWAIITSALAGAICFFTIILFTFIKPLNIIASQYFDWLYSNIIGNITNDANYSAFTTIIISLLFAALCYILFVKIDSFFVAFAFTFTVLLFIGVYRPNAPLAAILLITLYTIIFCFLSIYRNLKRKKIDNKSKSSVFVVFMIPFSIFALIIAMLLPKHDYPLQISWLDNLYNQLYYATATINTSNDNLFSFAYHTTSDNLDSNAYPNELKVITVDTDKPEYLKYAVKDKYTGFSWVDTNKSLLPFSDSQNEENMSLFEMIKGINYLNPVNIQLIDFAYKNDISVTFERIKANYIFTPINTLNLHTGTMKASICSNSIVFINGYQNKGYTYNLQSYSIDYGSEKFMNLLRNSTTSLYSTAENNGQNAIVQTLVKRSEKISETYLQLQQNLPVRVADLAKNITRAATNNYDEVKAIEQYLAKNMEYTLTPPKRPMNRDLVDFFLFDSKKGFCTSYASAMTIMVRTLGIPARYCEGYVMPNQSPTQTEYTVTNKQAHAWCEVYFEGFGWVPFEPTKTYNVQFYTNAAYTPQQLSDQTPQGAMPSGLSPQQVGNETTTPPPPPKVLKVPPKTANNIAFILVLSICALVFILAVAILIICLRNDKKIKKMFIKAQFCTPKDGIIDLYKYYLGCLTLLNIKMEDKETAFEFCERIKSEDKYFSSFQKVTEAFVEARYNPLGSKASTQRDVYDYNREFSKLLLERIGKARYYYYHYLIGIV
jgi:hypothetical protein